VAEQVANQSGIYRLGIDIGGTFTDLTLINEETGEMQLLKTPSVPEHPSQAVVNGIRDIVELAQIDPEAIGYFVHGTTIALNTVIERSGADTGLLVTRGFSDILELRRLRLPNPHIFHAQKPVPLVPRRQVKPIDERLLADGSILRELSEQEVIDAVENLVNQGISAIAICFLHSYRNRAHEDRAKEIIQENFPGLYVCTSSEVWPQQREYERALISVINAHIGTKMRDYFNNLERDMAEIGIDTVILSTKSNGGIMSVRSAKEVPVETLLSGPSSGVTGALYAAKTAGLEKVITLDMGGTSADIAVLNGDIPYSTDNKVGDFPLIMPATDISCIGAGGGSIAWLDSAGVLKVGPRSAGADPGPACYGRGGVNPTVTDAYVTVGILNPARFLGGKMPLDPDLARASVEGIAAELGQSVGEAASSILRVATSNMYAEFLPLMARRGVEPTDYALLPYGGAGPTHAFMLAEEVGMRQVIVPLNPGTLCSLGSLVADLRGDFIRTIYRPADELDEAEVARVFATMGEEAKGWLADQDFDMENDHYIVQNTADIRYKGQAFEIEVEVPDDLDLEALIKAFHDRYESIYGYQDPEARVELINARTRIVGFTPKPELSRVSSGRDPEDVEFETREIYWKGDTSKVRVYQREDLVPGMRISGPVVIEQYDTTTFVTPSFEITVDDYGNIIGEVKNGG